MLSLRLPVVGKCGDGSLLVLSFEVGEVSRVIAVVRTHMRKVCCHRRLHDLRLSCSSYQRCDSVPKGTILDMILQLILMGVTAIKVHVKSAARCRVHCAWVSIVVSVVPVKEELVLLCVKPFDLLTDAHEKAFKHVVKTGVVLTHVMSRCYLPSFGHA